MDNRESDIHYEVPYTPMSSDGSNSYVSNKLKTYDYDVDPIMKKIRSWVSKENLIYDDNDTEGKLQPSRKKQLLLHLQKKCWKRKTGNCNKKTIY